ncbi:MAG: hypothetical protein AMS24_00055 [Chlamydiae bacterium SM23_39]|nr:MAG: hypothetical protein AMS24_00055 [Chlamydiae bacterium SM23_39]
MLNLKIVNIFLNKITSTQKWAEKKEDTFDKSLITCITAKEQTEGIGRFNKKWISPTGNLYSTFYFQLPINIQHIYSIGIILAISLATILKKKGLDIKIKWPNDLLLNNKKIAGILCNIKNTDDSYAIFLGIGINLNMDKKYFSLTDQPISSLKNETKKNWNIKKTLIELQNQFLKNLKIFLKKGFLPFHKNFEKFLSHKNKNIYFSFGKKFFSGKIYKINEDGSLTLKLKSNKLKTFYSGEIIY